MRDLSTAQRNALASGRVIRRIFMRFDITLTQEDRYILFSNSEYFAFSDSGSPVIWTDENMTTGVTFWDGDHPLTVGDTRYLPVGQIPQVGNVQQVSDLSVPGLSISVPGLPGPLWDAIFGRVDWHQKRAEIDIGILSTETMNIVGGLLPWFRGFLDKATVRHGAPGEAAVLELQLESVARELTRSNPRLRTDADQRERDNADLGYRNTARIGEVSLEWGDLTKKGNRKGGKKSGRGGGLLAGGGGSGGGRGQRTWP